MYTHLYVYLYVYITRLAINFQNNHIEDIMEKIASEHS